MSSRVNAGDIGSLAPSLEPLARVAIALGDWRKSVVFIGGAVAPLLQTHPPFPRVRPTRDVDAISAASSFSVQGEMDSALSQLGFRRDPASRAHANRWIAPGDVEFDLVPAGSFLGGTGSNWDEMAIRYATERELLPGLSVKHVNAPSFIVLKWAAFNDRGGGNLLYSVDVEDILALLASRPSLTDEIAASQQDARDYLKNAARTILGDRDNEDLLEAHLGNATPREAVIRGVHGILRAIATL